MPLPDVASNFSTDGLRQSLSIDQEPTYNLWVASISMAPFNFACADIVKVRGQTRQSLTKWCEINWKNNY